MTPTDIAVITLDGHTHSVTEKTPISIAVHQGEVGTVQYADADGNLTNGEGRTSFLVTSEAGHRYSCGCGLSFDAADTELDDPRFDQGSAVDCPSC